LELRIIHSGMPLKTGYNIISRFLKTGRRTPQSRGSKAEYYDSKIIMRFVCEFLSNNNNSNTTLEEIRYEIWKKKKYLLFGSPPPSTSWLDRKLREALWTWKVSTVEPQLRNSPEVILERQQFVFWLQNLSVIDAQRHVF
jgi:hypothetical protein